MKVYCINASQENEKIRNAVINMFPNASVEFVSDISEIKGVYSDENYIVIPHEKVHKIMENITNKFTEILIYNKEHLAVCQEIDKLLDLRNKYVSENNWAAVKSVNDVLLDFDFLLKHTKSYGLPDYMQIETTSKCNAKCIMCSHYFTENKNTDNLSNETISNLADCLPECRTISLNGMGEPFISPYVSEQIDYYVGFGIRMVTNTNLSVLNKRLVEQIRENFDWIEISCDGSEKNTYEAIRKNLNFEKFCENLKILSEECPDTRKHIASVIMRQNVKNMPNLVELAKLYNANIITFMTLNSNIIIGNGNDEMHHYPKVLEYFSAKALEKGIEIGMKVIVPNAQHLNRKIEWKDVEEEYKAMNRLPLYKSPDEEERMLHIAGVVEEYLLHNDEIQRDTVASDVTCSGICDWILKRSYIDLKGNVCLCCRNQSFHVGNVNETQNFYDVWNNKLYQKMREIFYSGYLPECCLKCGMVESGNLEFLQVNITDNFYNDPQFKQEQKKKLKSLLHE
jgi:MoaA/NifB/PqqE/SkfB family radical SAM enzyme